MEPFTKLTSTTVVLPIDNIDTDQIIPARYLRGTTREGLGEGLFADWRRDKTGALSASFPLNSEAAQRSKILVAGENFGCGSSREHAPWALMEFGFRAVVSRSIADIFKNNAIKNGLLPVEVAEDAHVALLQQPGADVTIELDQKKIRLPNGQWAQFPLDRFAQQCLLKGIDTLDHLMAQEEAIRAYERTSKQ